MSRRRTWSYVGGLTAVGIVIWLGLLGTAGQPGDEPDGLAESEPPPVVASTLTPSTQIPATTSTTLDPGLAIHGFIGEIADAIDRDDVDFLYAALHPAVQDLFGETDCRQFIGDEVLLMENYRLVSGIVGPVTRTVSGVTVEVYHAFAAFGFRGGQFESEVVVAFVDGSVRWFTPCG